MSDPTDQTKSAEPTPEQLLTLLDLQIAAKRARRREAPRQRSALIAVALMVIMGGALLAFLVLKQMAEDLPPAAGGQLVPIPAQNSQ